MEIWKAIVVGIVQGLSEFLPISSSGHLILVPWLLGWDDFDDPSVKKAFDVALHLGTFVAVGNPILHVYQTLRQWHFRRQ